MQEFDSEMKKTLVGMCCVLLLTVGGSWLLGHAEFISGLILGTAASIFYYLFICYRIRKSVDLSVVKAVAFMRTGWLIRLSFIVIILILSLKVPKIHFGAAIVGLFSLQIVLFTNAVILIGKSFLFKKEHKN